MRKSAKARISFIVAGHWLILTYVVAALVWWYVALSNQNQRIHDLRLEALSTSNNATSEKEKIDKESNRKTAQYLGEGLTFLLLTIAGVFFVYRSVRKQMTVSQQQHNFLMAVTHELKTPIAVAKLNLETMQKRKLDEGQQKKLISNTLFEAGRLNELINNILVASQFESGVELRHQESIDFSAMVNDVVEEYATRFADRKMEVEIEEGIKLSGEKVMLQMAISNLIDNATKYSAKDKPVEVELMKAGQSVILKVKDQGNGIPDAEKEKVFAKFYRLGDEQTRTAKGTGLGLYLTKKIAEAHNADIHVTDNKPRGSIFEIRFSNKV
jgi:two-component system, OmpR family, sensor histidine kinase CiaH